MIANMRTIGGSSAINYLMYVRGSKGDYEAWESLGNQGWGWEGMLPYFRKHQTLDIAKTQPKDPQFMPDAAREKYHGNNGPVHTSFNDYYAPIEEDFVKACYEVGKGENTLSDAYSGDHLGFYSSLAAVDRTNDVGKRSYSATAYLRPNLHRPNLKVLVEALASKIVLETGAAKGVQFLHQGGQYTVRATKEVIVSAGAIQTPQILELSGIGDPYVLARAGVACKIENRRVGYNYQDHVLGGMMWDLKEGITGFDTLHGADFAKVHQEIYEKTKGGMYSSPGKAHSLSSDCSRLTTT
jgi:choline dehydrogenase-like flavoprotein